MSTKSFAQRTDVILEGKINVSANHLPNEHHLETWMAINPTNPDNLILTSMVVPNGEVIKYSVIYNSFDRGKSWELSKNKNTGDKHFQGGDPYVAYDPNGNAYFSTLLNGITIWKSSDGGISWNKLNNVPGSKAFDRQFTEFDLNSENKGTMYVTAKFPIKSHLLNPDVMATIISKDGGKSFNDPVLLISDVVNNEFINNPNALHVTPNGKVLVSYSSYYWQPGMKLDQADGSLSVAILAAGGQWYEKIVKISSTSIFGHAKGAQSLKCLGVGGMTSNVRQPNSIYTTWIQAINGYCQIMYSKSEDEGSNWSEAKIVNGLGLKTDMSNPNISVNNDGVLLVVWHDRRNDASGNCFQLFGAYSKDGGGSFHNFIIEEKLSCPCRKSNGEVNDQCRWINGGDTQGVICLSNGSFQLSYVSEVNDVLQLFTTNIQIP